MSSARAEELEDDANKYAYKTMNAKNGIKDKGDASAFKVLPSIVEIIWLVVLLP